jgi:surfactin family lipopeptide synthetase C
MARHPNIEAIYPQSPTQQAMLFPALLAPNSGIDIEQGVFSLHGDLQVAALRRAFERAVERYDVLRTLFTSSGQERPLQVVRRRVNLPWDEFDWRDASPSSNGKDGNLSSPLIGAEASIS